MHRFYVLFSAILFAIIACNSARNPSDTNLTTAINEYLAKHGEACTVIGRQFPIDIPRSGQNGQYGIGSKLAALEQADLVQATETTAVVHGMLDPLRGLGSAQPVKRYELTESGRKYFHQISGTFGETEGFCYGQKRVDSIVKWTQPSKNGPASQTEVTYTYKIADAADWAGRPEIQQAFSDIRTTMTGASKTTAIVGLQLTNNGWEVPGQ